MVAEKRHLLLGNIVVVVFPTTGLIVGPRRMKVRGPLSSKTRSALTVLRFPIERRSSNGPSRRAEVRRVEVVGPG